MAVRVIREEFNKDYRGVVIDDASIYEEVRDYVSTITPALADRVEYYDRSVEPISAVRAPPRARAAPQGARPQGLVALRWLAHHRAHRGPHGDRREHGQERRLSNLEETVFRNNLEAAEEIARQLRLRDIGGIIVIDFVDMEITQEPRRGDAGFRDALARDKTRTQVFDISELGLVRDDPQAHRRRPARVVSHCLPRIAKVAAW